MQKLRNATAQKCKDKQCPFNHDESTVEKQLGRGGSRKRCEEFIFHYKLWQLTQSDVQRAVTSVDDVVTVKKSDGSTHSPFTDWQEGPAILQAQTGVPTEPGNADIWQNSADHKVGEGGGKDYHNRLSDWLTGQGQKQLNKDKNIPIKYTILHHHPSRSNSN